MGKPVARRFDHPLDKQGRDTARTSQRRSFQERMEAFRSGRQTKRRNRSLPDRIRWNGEQVQTLIASPCSLFSMKQ